MTLVTWNRIEPIVDAETVEPGLGAPLADPLWLLGRQWQVGELTAEDASTPITASIKTSTFPIQRLHVGPHVRAFDAGMPLETFVEPEPPAPPDLRMRLSAGRDLALALTAADHRAAAARLPVFAKPAPVDDRTAAALVRALSSRAIDGELVMSALQARGASAIAHELDASATGAARNAIAATLEKWQLDYLARTGRAAPTAWRDERAAYEVSLTASVDSHDVVLQADRYRGGRLDWSDFTMHKVPREDGGTSAAVTKETVVLPSPLEFTGGPARRFFEIERGGASYGALAGAPPDVATALLVELTLVFGGDWFVVPVPLAVGALGRIDEIRLTDGFEDEGNTTAVLTQRIRSAGWRMFECSSDRSLADFLVVIPTVEAALEGPPIEVVSLGIDEAANIVWASEDTLADPLGLPQRVEHVLPRRPTSAERRYVPLLPPPASWFPLVRRGKNPTDTRYVGASLRSLPSTKPRGHILSGWPQVGFLATEVPLEGLRIERRWQMAVGTEGRRALWLSRADRIGRGPAASGLAADQILPPSQ
jgi:hypothetical protein